MSLQRVFESARKLGVPVIMTDPGGREPMVIMTLEQFEALAGEGAPAPEAGSVSKPAPQKSKEELRVERILAEQAVETNKSRMAEVMIDLASLPSSNAENPEISLEERFYLEPVDDETGV
jgi:hypothetical protein